MDEEEDEDEEDEVQKVDGVKANPVLIPADNPPAPTSSAPVDSVPISTEDPPAPVDSALVASAPPTKTWWWFILKILWICVFPFCL